MADKNTIIGVDISEKKELVPQVSSELTTDLTGKTGKDIISAMWSIDPNMAKEVSNISNVYSSPYGMFRSVPIVCKGADCAYKDICMVQQANRVIGQRCPMEVATIVSRFDQWCQHFGIEIVNDFIDPKDLVDATLIKDLVTVEVQQLRGENKIALNGDFMNKVLLDIDKKCTPYFGQAVSPESEFLLTLQQRKEKILNQLNATRKDKAQDKRAQTPSDEAMRLFQQVRDMERQHIPNGSITDIEFDENGNVIMVEEEPEEVGDSNGNDKKNTRGNQENGEESGDISGRNETGDVLDET